VTVPPTTPLPSSDSTAASSGALPATARSRSARRDLAQEAVDRFEALPRVGKWIALAAIGAGVLLFFREVIGPRVEQLNTRADRTASLLEASARRANDLPSTIADRVVVYGPNSVPGREAAVKEKFANSVADILGKRGISQYGFDVRSSQSLAGNILPMVAAELSGTMRRTIAELKFEASGETVNGVISDLERSPEVDAITDLRLSYSSKTRRVSAAVTIERWGVSPQGGGS
jgi:hypothetical protein